MDCQDRGGGAMSESDARSSEPRECERGGSVAPRDAVATARASADGKRAEGKYPADTTADSGAPPSGPDLARLREWAIVEVDSELLYSTRTGGAPITWVKRMMLRLLRQYTTELEAQQTRFNVGV